MSYSITFYISDDDVEKAIKKFGSLDNFKDRAKAEALKLLVNDECSKKQ